MPRRATIASLSGTILVIGAATAVALPATLDLDIARPGSSTTGSLAAFQAASSKPSTLPEGPVKAQVEEIDLTTSAGEETDGTTLVTKPRRTILTSVPQDVTGFGVVGMTWSPGSDIDTEAVRAKVRTKSDGAWSKWRPMEVHLDEHAPDAGSAEAKGNREGTREFLVGHVDKVQTRLVVPADAELPDDLELAVIEPGKPEDTVEELPAIDTDDGTTKAPSTHKKKTDADLNLAAGSYTPSPTIYSRAQWGADESIREDVPPTYRTIHGGFVHHTAGTNDYTEADVPSIIQGIYAYHVQTNGWRDVGYNFFIDKFGRIWEGRNGGVAMPVEGAHTSGYNTDSFAASALGNFETVEPTPELIQAYGALFAWKLSLHGVSAGATNVDINGTTFSHAIKGHRDAGQTLCPGQNLYDAIPQIRTLAASLQKSWAGRDLESNIAGTSHSDLVARRKSDGRVFTMRTGGFAGFDSTRTSTTFGSTTREQVVTPDVTGDGKADLIFVRNDGSAGIRKGRGDGTFAAVFKNLSTSTFSGVSKITAVGNIGGTSANDLVGKNAKGYLVRYTGNGAGGFTRAGTTRSLGGFDKLAATGDVNQDGRRDLIGRKSGALYYFKGSGSGTFGAPVKLATQSPAWSSLAQISGYGDFTGDGRGDLIGRDGSNRGWIYPASGSGFGKPLGPFSGVDKTLVGAVNLAGNSLPDLMMRSGSTLYVKPNSGRVSLAKPIDSGVNLAGATALMNAGDWNRDGKGDFLAKMSDGSVRLYRGYGTGKFTSPVTIATGLGSVGVMDAVGDVTGDGFPDLMGRTSDGTIKLWPGKGSTKVGASIVMRSSASGTRLVGAGRWNSGNTPDVLFVNGSSLVVHESNGPGGLVSYRTLSVDLSGYNAVLGVRDLRGGAGGDLIARSGSYLYAFERNSTGTGVTRTYLGALSTGYDLLG
ncbi:Repeat domain-containing protein [Nocardioides sp. YR527]|uniref:FG-GAP-like repeat-containing protein n=1 Tax=Nocardioides sp. YR527 TaxID=1881028 RepID=UPI00088E5FD5|nr:FG-GAP-like repeat-containing protein [Nocardioides sp. YR527]SDK22793.1 Repeat domain-containing protein [Nocardioides sp. YR527]